MGTSLSGLTPATTFDGLLKTSDNEPLDGTLKAISTGDGTDTILQLSNSALKISGDTEIDSSGLNALIVKRNGTELLKTDGSGLNGAIVFNGSTGNIFSLGVKSNDFNIWDGSYLGGGDLRFSILADGKTGIGAQTPTAQLHIKGSGATSATTSLLVQNSAGSELLKVTDDGAIDFGVLGLDFSNDGSGGTMSVASDRYIKLASSLSTYSALSAHLFKTFDGSAYTEAMRITGANDQFVGIGETTPTARLHVKGSGNTSADYALKILNSDDSTLFDIRNDSVIRIAPNSTNPVSFRNAKMQDGNAVFGTTTIPASTRMTIKGQGATSATTALLVQNSAGTELMALQDDGATRINLNNRLKLVNNAGSTRVTFDGEGNLGIRQGTPSARLHIRGAGLTSATTSLLVTDSAGTDLLKVLDNGQISASGDRLTIGDGANVTLRILASGNAASGNNYIQPLGTPANQRVIVTGNNVNTIKAVDLDASNVYIGHGINQTAATGTLSIKGSGATSATTALLVQNSAGTEALKVRDDGVVDVAYSFTGGAARLPDFIFTSNSAYPTNGGSIGKNNNVNQHVSNIYSKGVTHITDNTTSSTTLNASAKLQVDSTTQGFLPPRMTTTERDAITTPAAGLMVYNTTTNKAQCYNGTAWQDLF